MQKKRPMKRVYLASIFARLSKNTKYAIVNTREMSDNCPAKQKMYQFWGKKSGKMLAIAKKMLLFHEIRLLTTPHYTCCPSGMHLSFKKWFRTLFYPHSFSFYMYFCVTW